MLVETIIRFFERTFLIRQFGIDLHQILMSYEQNALQEPPLYPKHLFLLIHKGSQLIKNLYIIKFNTSTLAHSITHALQHIPRL